MKLSIDIKFLLIAAASFYAMIAIVSGTAMKYVDFASVDSEMATVFMLGMMGILTLGLTFKIK